MSRDPASPNHRRESGVNGNVDVPVVFAGEVNELGAVTRNSSVADGWHHT